MRSATTPAAAAGHAGQVLGVPDHVVFGSGLRGVGSIAQRRVRCLTPELQLRQHLGYEPDADDHHDMRRLPERFQLELRPPYRVNS